MLTQLPDYIPPMSPQQIVWLEAYKACMLTNTTDSLAAHSAKHAVKEYNQLFGENK